MGRKKVCSCINFRNGVDARSGKTGARASFFGSEGGRRPRRGRAVGAGRGTPVGRRLQREGFWSMGLGVEPAGCQGCRAAIYSS